MLHTIHYLLHAVDNINWSYPTAARCGLMQLPLYDFQQHLPEMNEVQMEQVQQRRVYGLEILSVPQERMMRDIFRGGKEIMTKDK